MWTVWFGLSRNSSGESAEIPASTLGLCHDSIRVSRTSELRLRIRNGRRSMQCDLRTPCPGPSTRDGLLGGCLFAPRDAQSPCVRRRASPRRPQVRGWGVRQHASQEREAIDHQPPAPAESKTTSGARLAHTMNHDLGVHARKSSTQESRARAGAASS